MSKISVKLDSSTFIVEVNYPNCNHSVACVSIDGQEVEVLLPEKNALLEDMEWVVVNNRPYEVVLDRDLRWIKSSKGLYPVEVRDLEAGMTPPVSTDGRIKAPIPGEITRILVSPGQTVEAGQPVMVLEAMKMENEIRAPRPGIVTVLNVTAGQGVLLHQLLAEIQ